MKILFKSESELNERIAQFGTEHHDRMYVAKKPDSYPCVCIVNIDSNYFDECIIEIVDFVYPSDFT